MRYAPVEICVLINLLMLKEGDCNLMRIYGDDETEAVVKNEKKGEANLLNSFKYCKELV